MKAVSQNNHRMKHRELKIWFQRFVSFDSFFLFRFAKKNEIKISLPKKISGVGKKDQERIFCFKMVLLDKKITVGSSSFLMCHFSLFCNTRQMLWELFCTYLNQVFLLVCPQRWVLGADKSSGSVCVNWLPLLVPSDSSSYWKIICWPKSLRLGNSFIPMPGVAGAHINAQPASNCLLWKY